MAALLPRWFLVLNGAALLVIGFTLIGLRLRERGGGGLAVLRSSSRLLGVLWALCCLLMGALLLGMATGYVPQPGGWNQAPAAPRGGPPQFPTDR